MKDFVDVYKRQAQQMAEKMKKAQFDFEDYLESMNPVSYTHLPLPIRLRPLKQLPV